ncbi:MAG TPA: BamA/TamA family outer membrane protein [Geobacteraceae bacterium]
MLGLLFALNACTSMVPRKDLPYPLTNESYGDPVKMVTIPLPAIGSSPNEGITVGGLTAFLLHNNKDEVSTLIAPQLTYNKYYGVTASLYGAFYPMRNRYWEANLAQSAKVNFDYEIKGRDRTFMDGKLELNGHLYAFADGSARFYGFQARTPLQNETNYNDQELGFNFSAGYEIFRNLQLYFGERLRDVAIHQGAVKSVPFIRDVFTPQQVPGINGFTAHAQRLSLVYSTLDSRDMPTTGFYAKATAEVSAKMLGSSADYRHYEAEVKGYVPLREARYISVARLSYSQVLGNGVPFLEQSILGGETTLRGYGRNRFVDSSYLLLNLEERIRLFTWEVFHVNSDWELAPFIDLGSVMQSLDRAKARDFEFNPGVGFRAVVRPNIVGRIDVGFGKEGPAVFVGLGYPF